MKWLVLVALTCLPAVVGGAEIVPNRPGCAQASSEQFFFPQGTLGERTERFDADQFTRTWYSRHLRAMFEPSLSCKEPPGEAYRFLWLRTWGCPIAVRVERTGDVATLFATELDGAGGYDPGKVARRTQRRLSPGEWKLVSAGLSGIGFWKMPGYLPRDGTDGAQWILEGRNGAKYHVVDRWSPETGAYRKLCLALVDLAGLRPSGKEKRDAVY